MRRWWGERRAMVLRKAEGQRTLSVRFPVREVERLDECAVMLRVSMSEYLRLAALDFADRLEREDGFVERVELLKQGLARGK